MNVITVKKYMTQKSTKSFDFMKKFNNDNPMPFRTMILDEVIQESQKMIRVKCHADILQEKTTVCMKCGRPLTNPVSQYFGVGPECGGHNYVNPFETKEELKQAVAQYRQKLNNIKWEGWIPKSAIETGFDNIPQGTQKKSEVKIEYRPSTKINEETAAYISFTYDNKLVSLMRSQPKRFWHSDTKQWELPASVVETLLPQLADYTVTVTGEYTKKQPVTVPTDYDFEFKTVPYQHQVEGFNYGLSHSSFLLGDEQGLGKTKQVIDIAVAKKEIYGYKHCLIVCGVNGLKWNWKNEISVHSNEVGYILGTRYRRNGKEYIGSTQDRYTDLLNLDDKPYFLITNIESLRNEKIMEILTTQCKKGNIGMIAVDEIHKAKNPGSQQSKALLKLTTDTKIAMTGTPLMNSPVDLFVPLKWLGKERHSFYAFRNYYCLMGGFGGHQIVGYRNLNQLQTILDTCMLRRRKTEVLDLPEKVYMTEYVEMGSKQEKIYKEVGDTIKENIDKIKVSPNPLAQLIRLRQATAATEILSTDICESAKLDRLEELVEEVVANGDKTIIFSNWTEVTELVEKRLKSYNPAVITGKINDTERDVQKNKFMTQDNCKCIIGTIGAMGTGLTLTAGSTVIFLDEPWNRGNKEQAEDRAHRIGATKTVTVITLICKNTIDERINDIVYRKGKMADILVDGEVDLSKSAMVDYLLS